MWLDPFVEGNASLWWPNGFGPQPLYTLEIELLLGGVRSDAVSFRFGMREVTQTTTRVSDSESDVDARTFVINGRPLFLRGGNWIGTDARLRLSRKRYDDEVRLYAGTGLSMLRVWGGGIAERPEFYEACDRYGIVVMQDFWLSSEYENGEDEKDFIAVFQRCAEDTIRMLRRHPSLIVWCGANECDPTPTLDTFLRDTIASVDGTRGYIRNSLRLSTDDRTYGDGPYGMLDPIAQFFQHPLYRPPTAPFNPEIGSLGQPVLETLQLTMPPEHLDQHPGPRGAYSRCAIHEDWYWHMFSQFFQGSNPDQVYAYGDTSKIDRYAFFAQLVQLVQYQAFIEGANGGMWKWYTGTLIWKAQNPWPGLRGALYDWFLDQTGGYFGVKRATRPIHVQLDLAPPGGGLAVTVVNQSPARLWNGMVNVAFFAADGTFQAGPSIAATVESNSAATFTKPPLVLPQWPVVFVRLRFTAYNNVRDESFYWLLGTARDFTSLEDVPRVPLSASAEGHTDGDRQQLAVTLHNPTPHMTLWVRLQLLDGDGRTRILPAHCSDNYVCLTPTSYQAVTIDHARADIPDPSRRPRLVLEGYNVDRMEVPIVWR